MKCKSKPKLFNLFLRKWRNSFHLDKIGNIFFTFKNYNFKDKFLKFSNAPHAPFSALHSLINPLPTYFATPLQKCPSCAPAGNYYTC